MSSEFNNEECLEILCEGMEPARPNEDDIHSGVNVRVSIPQFDSDGDHVNPIARTLFLSLGAIGDLNRAAQNVHKANVEKEREIERLKRLCDVCHESFRCDLVVSMVVKRMQFMVCRNCLPDKPGTQQQVIDAVGIDTDTKKVYEFLCKRGPEQVGLICAAIEEIAVEKKADIPITVGAAFNFRGREGNNGTLIRATLPKRISKATIKKALKAVDPTWFHGTKEQHRQAEVDRNSQEMRRQIEIEEAGYYIPKPQATQKMVDDWAAALMTARNAVGFARTDADREEKEAELVQLRAQIKEEQADVGYDPHGDHEAAKLSVAKAADPNFTPTNAESETKSTGHAIQVPHNLFGDA